MCFQVSHDELEEKQKENEALKLALRKHEEVHKSLMQRYSLVKSAIEQSFIKQLPLYVAREKAEQKGQGLGIKKKRSDRKSDLADLVGAVDEDREPTDLLEVMTGNNGDVRMVVELMLDHLKLIATRSGMAGLSISKLKKGQAISEQGEWMGLDDGGRTEEKVVQNDGYVNVDQWSVNENKGEEDRMKNSLFNHFDGLGADLDLPKYLRMSGKVQVSIFYILYFYISIYLYICSSMYPCNRIYPEHSCAIHAKLH